MAEADFRPERERERFGHISSRAADEHSSTLRACVVINKVLTESQLALVHIFGATDKPYVGACSANFNRPEGDHGIRQRQTAMSDANLPK